MMTLRWSVGRRAAVGLAALVAVLVLGAAAPSPAAARPSAQGLMHCGQVTRNETWTAVSSPHIVTCDVEVRNSTLTLEPGATLLMDEGVSIVIGRGSTLLAEGNENANIRVQPNSRQETPGFWGQVRFTPDAEEGRLSHVSMISGGADGRATLEARGTVVALDYMRFQRSGGPPLAFSADVVGPSLAAPGGAAGGTACQRVVFISNEDPAIEVYADAAVDITRSQSWPHLCIAYRVAATEGDDTLTIGGPDSPSLSLDPGVTLRFDGDAGLTAGAAPDQPGQLEANGTAEQPVTLAGVDETPGSWNGLHLTAHTGGSSLINTTVANGGRGGRPMVAVDAPGTAALGLRLEGAAGYPLEIAAAAVGDFFAGLYDQAAPVFVDNGVPRVRVVAGDAIDITRTTLWAGAGLPYELDGTLTVAGEADPAILTLSGAAELIFDGDEALVVGGGDDGPAQLILESAPDAAGVPQGVTLRGEPETPGSWAGVELTAAAELAVLERATIAHGGTAERPMVRWGPNAAGDVRRTTLRGAPGYPIALPLAQAEAVLGEPLEGGLRHNQLADNGLDRILIRTAGQPLAAARVTWRDPGAPVELDGPLAVGGPRDVRLSLGDGLQLLFRERAGLEIGAGVAQATVSVEDLEPDRPVRLAAADPTAGWSGVAVTARGTLEGAGLTVGAAAADDQAADDLPAVDGAAVTVAGGRLTMARLELPGSGQGIGLAVSAGGRAEVTRSRIEGHRIGVRTRDGAGLTLTESFVVGNSEWGVRNEDSATCLRATRVFWGSRNGPYDPSDAPDGCQDATNISPAADRVSDDVRWAPWALDAEYTPSATPTVIYLPIARRGL